MAPVANTSTAWRLVDQLEVTFGHGDEPSDELANSMIVAGLRLVIGVAEAVASIATSLEMLAGRR